MNPNEVVGLTVLIGFVIGIVGVVILVIHVAGQKQQSVRQIVTRIRRRKTVVYSKMQEVEELDPISEEQRTATINYIESILMEGLTNLYQMPDPRLVAQDVGSKLMPLMVICVGTFDPETKVATHDPSTCNVAVMEEGGKTKMWES